MQTAIVYTNKLHSSIAKTKKLLFQDPIKSSYSYSSSNDKELYHI